MRSTKEMPVSISRLNPMSRDARFNQPQGILNAQEFETLSKAIEDTQKELKEVVNKVINQNEENEELRSTFNKSCRDFDSYK